MTQNFVRTDTFLDKILAHKQEEITAAKLRCPRLTIEAMARDADPARDMPGALRRETVALIAEIKHASPSKGVLIEDFDPVAIARIYDKNGAAAISVLTDAKFFKGDLTHLREAREAVRIPCLRKDFIIDPYQVFEGRAFGADAMLLIVAALSDGQLQELYQLTVQLGMTALVEAHDEREVERALNLGAKLIGINNRDLRTFEVDLRTTGRLARIIPEDVVLVAESGIQSAEDVYQMGQWGAHAVLVGEALARSKDVAASARAFSQQPRV